MNLKLTPIKLILFDLDDTLFDFSACWEWAMKAAISAHPLTCDLDPDEFYRSLKHHSDALWPLILEKKVTFTEYRQLRLIKASADFGLQVKAEMAETFQKLFLSKSMETIMPSPDVVSLLSQLADRYQLGIVTNGPADMAFEKIARLGFTHLFLSNTVFVSEIVGYHKPDRRIFQCALQQFGLRAEETIFVGDTWIADVVGAIDAGMKAVWYNPRKNESATNHAPLAVIEKLDKLLDLLKSLPSTH